MRLFIALDIEEEIRQRIARFLDGVREFSPEARWVRAESLHVTLKFIGERTSEDAAAIKQALASVSGAPIEIAFRAYGFFPSEKLTRVFWIGVEAGPELAKLAKEIDSATTNVGVAQEDHPFTPHLTLARGGGGSGNPRREKHEHPNMGFQRLQQKLAALPSPDFGSMTAREFYLYESQLLRGGARYTKIARFGLHSSGKSTNEQ